MNEIREYLEANLQSFNRSQKKIALFVLENPSRIKELELNEFAALSGTSRSTVLRFLQQLGYSGFREFKRHMALQPGNKGQNPVVNWLMSIGRSDFPLCGGSASFLVRCGRIRLIGRTS